MHLHPIQPSMMQEWSQTTGVTTPPFLVVNLFLRLIPPETGNQPEKEKRDRLLRSAATQWKRDANISFIQEETVFLCSTGSFKVNLKNECSGVFMFGNINSKSQMQNQDINIDTHEIYWILISASVCVVRNHFSYLLGANTESASIEPNMCTVR